MAKTYPVIIYPQSIISFLAKNPTPTLASYQPQKKFRDKNQKSKASRGFHGAGTVQLFGSLFIVGLVIFLSVNFLSTLWLVGVAWGLIGLGMWSVYVSLWDQSTGQVKTARPAALLISKQSSELVLRSLQREVQVRSLLQNKLLRPQGVSKAQQGVSEKNFFKALKAIFPDIIQGLEFKISDFPIPYSADFVLQHESGLSLDIEVDEMYVGSTKEPHHCIDVGKDDLRNDFFTSGNWVVVRFSEDQVVKSPQSCCKVIAEVVARVAGDYTYLQKLEGIPKLAPRPMWTIKEAKKMAKEDYRKTYLPKIR